MSGTTGKQRRHFQQLKTYADKTAKFNQIGLIQDTYLNSCMEEQAGRPIITRAQYDKVKGGVCLSLLVFWFKQKLAGGATFERGQGVHTAEQTGNQRIVASRVPDQIAYKALTTEGISASDARDELFSMNGLAVDGTWKDDVTVEPFTDIRGSFRCRPVCSFHIRVLFADRGSGHAVGLHRAHAGGAAHTAFFDPNIGEYSVKEEFYDEFFREWQRLTELAHNTTITSFVMTRVKLLAT